MSEDSDRFIELLGQHVEEEGVPRIYGRLLAALILNPDPRSLDELAEQLQVSKGSISSNARALDAAGLAERVTLPGDRRDFYRLSDDFVERMFRRQLMRQKMLIDRLEIGKETAPEPVRHRFDQLIQCFDEMIADAEARLGAGTRTD